MTMIKINDGVIDNYWYAVYSSRIIQLMINTTERWVNYHMESDNTLRLYKDGEDDHFYTLKIKGLEIPNRHTMYIQQCKDQISVIWIPFDMFK